MKIAFYLNLQGAGHCRRFEAIAPHFPPECELAVVGMDGPPQVADIGRPVERVSVPGYAPPSPSLFMQAQTLHDYHDFLVNHGGNAAFTLAMVTFLSRWQPDLLVADVGLEASILGRMCGIPVIYGRQHGQRWDKGHSLAYEWAYSLWAPFAEAMEQADCPQWIREKTFYSGGFCRFVGAEKAVDTPPNYAKDKPNILVMTGFGGTEITAQKIVQAAQATPDWQWHLLGAHPSMRENIRAHGVVENVWPYLCHADLVIANAGHNSTMEIAAAGVPAICIPAERPFAEQQCKAQVLQRLGLSIVSQAWPEPPMWAELWQRAKRLNPDRWASLQKAEAPQQVAQYIAQVARRCVKPAGEEPFAQTYSEEVAEKSLAS